MSAPSKGKLTVHIFPADDVAGQWVAECVECDLVTLGNDPPDTLEKMADALRVLALRAVFPSSTRPPPSR